MISSADFQKITTLIFDIDGTLTNGQAAYLNDGQVIKFFHHHDMHWIKLALRAGLSVGVISGADDPANRMLAENLALSFAVFGVKDKIAGLKDILQKYNLAADECLYLGDDVVDIPVIRAVGIGAAVADAVPELDEYAKWRTKSCGGCGAAQEVIHRVLREKGLLDKIMERYRQ